MIALRRIVLTPAFLVGIAVCVSSLALYLATLAPSLTWGHDGTGVDGGELLAAANTFGVPHPPGYPTYTLLLRLFATVMPIGDFAFRGNLMSAVFGAVSVGLLYAVILRMLTHLNPSGEEKIRVGGAAVGATMLATAPLFWAQAVMTEVYTLNAAFVGALLLVATSLAARRERLSARETTKIIVLFGLLLGLGLGNHLTLLAVGAPLLLWIGVRAGWRTVASPWVFGALALGLAIYVYLPISAAQNPPVNWGNADTAGGMVWMVTGRAYQEYLFGAPLASTPSQVLDLIELVFIQLNPLGIFLGLVGLVPLWRRDRWFIGVSIASILAMGGYSLSYFTVDSDVNTIPAFMLVSIWAGAGFQWVAKAIGEGASGVAAWRRVAWLKAVPSVAVILVGVGAIPVAAVILNYDMLNLRDDVRATDYARGVMAVVADGSTVLSAEEGPAFSMLYMGYVEAADRDVLPVAVPLLQFEWYWEGLRDRYPDRVPPNVTTDLAEAVRRLIAHNQGGSPVYLTYRDFSLRDGFTTTPLGDVYEVRVRE